MLNKESQVNEISKMLSDEEYSVFHDYIETHKFRLNKFLLDLKKLEVRTYVLASFYFVTKYN